MPHRRTRGRLPPDGTPADPTETGTRPPVAPAVAPLKADRLAKPIPLEADGKPIARQATGYALEYPFVGDLDGDGRPDLLLGDRERGRLRVFRNVGAAPAPRLAAPVWFDELVPTGKVPYG